MWEEDILKLSNLLQYIIDQYRYEISLYDQWKERADSIHEEKLHKVLDKLLTALDLISHIITVEITLQNLNLLDRQSYGSFFETVNKILARTDLDKLRKGQIIHDLATQLELNSERLEGFAQASLDRLVEQDMR